MLARGNRPHTTRARAWSVSLLTQKRSGLACDHTPEYKSRNDNFAAMNNEWSRASKVRQWQEAREVSANRTSFVDCLYVLRPCHTFYTR